MSTTFRLRRDRRLAVQGTVYFVGRDIHGKGTLWNLSLTGCRIASDHSAAPGLCLSMLIELPGTDAIIVPCAKVAWINGMECGIDLTTIRAKDIQRLRRFITA